MAKKSPAATTDAPAQKKTVCPVTKEQFLAAAKPVAVTINGVPMVAEVKEFSTGSFGWYLNGKVNVMVGDKAVSTQLGFNFTCVGSKPEA